MDALMMAKEGAKIVVSDINAELGEQTAQDIRDAGGDAIFVKCDVTKSAEVAALMDAAVDKYGKLDVLVANAGIAVWGNIVDTAEEDFDRVIAINLKGVFLSMKYAIPKMIAGGGGSIINMSSVSGRKGFPGLTAYNASKGGVTLLTYNVAAAYGDKGIRCNCLCPGMVDLTGLGDMMQGIQREAAAARGVPAPPPPRSTGVPHGRWGRPAEVANLIIYLASDESTWTNGAAIIIDGGNLARR